jgi:hypothetical protein
VRELLGDLAQKSLSAHKALASCCKGVATAARRNGSKPHISPVFVPSSGTTYVLRLNLWIGINPINLFVSNHKIYFDTNSF